MENTLNQHIKRKKFSHGYFLCGDLDKSNEVARETARHIFCDTKNFCGKCGPCLLDINQNPDFFYFDREKFQIEDSRRLKEFAFKKSFSGNGKVFQVKFREITKEAQNALLKIMEEPPYGTYFFMCAPDQNSIIDTLKSRLILLFNKPEEVYKNEKASPLFSISVESQINLFAKSGRQDAENLILNLLNASYKKNEPIQNTDKIKKIKNSLVLCRENLPLNLISLYLFS